MIKFILISAAAEVAYRSLDNHFNSIETAIQNEYMVMERRQRNILNSIQMVKVLDTKIQLVYRILQVIQRDISILNEEKKRLMHMMKRTKITFIIQYCITSIENKITESKNKIKIVKRQSSELKRSVLDAKYLLALDAGVYHFNMNVIQ